MDSLLNLYNTEKRLKQKIVPLNGHTILMYTCGPTVYNYAHIGNFRTYVFEDLLRRTLKFFGLSVRQVMNITDVDDKTILGALKKGISLKEFTEPYIEAFFQDLKMLHIEPVEAYPLATDYIPAMVELIQNLLEKKIAYRGSDGSIYFAIKKFPSYGRLSHLRLDELKIGASGELTTDEYDKEAIADFALWKSYDPERDGNIFWESPLGPGRPGWHIECSAMAFSLLGESIDIHAGGVDNIFPHHENEIAQCESCTHKPFVAHWVHAEHLLVDHKKMSKSLGNFYTLRDLLQKGYSGKEVRYMLLHTHYRTQLNFTLAGMEGARSSLERLSDFILRLHEIQSEHSSNKVEEMLQKAEKLFKEALADDLNISVALAVVFDLVREINALCDREEISKTEAEKSLKLFASFDKVLGVLPLDIQEIEVPRELQEALEKRQQARQEKNWALADHFRDFILSKGYFIEDKPEGLRLKKTK